MTKEEAKKISELFAAIAEGKTLQYRNKDSKVWHDAILVGYAELHPINLDCWRIKPQPLERWCVSYKDGSLRGFENRERAEMYLAYAPSGARVILMREVVQ